MTSCAMKPTEAKLCAFCSCCLTDVEKVIEFEDKIISIIELVAPNRVEIGIMGAIQKVLDASKPVLLELAAACQAESVKLTPVALSVLQKTGLADSSGQISQQVKKVVNSTISVTQK